MIFSDLLNAYKFDKRFKYIFAVSLVTWIIIILLSVLWFNYTDALGDRLLFDNANLDQENIGQLTQFSEQLLELIIKVTIVSIATILAFYALLITEKTLVINQWVKRKLNYKILLKTMLARLVFFLPWIAPIILLLIPLLSIQSAFQYNPGLLYSFITLVYLNMAFWLVISYFAIFFYNNYLHHQKIFKAIGKSFTQGTKSLLKVAPRLIISILVLAAFWFIIQFLIKINLSFVIINLILFFYVFTGLRIYVLEKLL